MEKTPNNRPPGATCKIATCSGEDMAKSIPAAIQAKTIQTTGFWPKAAIPKSTKIVTNWQTKATLPGV